MGSALQRLEVLLIGLVLVIAGAVVAILMIVHPSTPTAVVPASPTPIATIPAVALTRTVSAAATTVPVPTPALIDNAAPLSALAPTSVPQRGSTGELPGRTLTANLWPMLLLAVGLIGLLLAARRFRRRRMSYTNQNVSQLLAAADAETRATNLRVMRTLAQQGVLPAALATAAGIDLKASAKQPHRRLIRLPLPRVALPHLTFPALAFPTLRRPAWLRRRARRPMTIDSPSPTVQIINHPIDSDNCNGAWPAAARAEALTETAQIEPTVQAVTPVGNQILANERRPLPAAGLSNKVPSLNALLMALRHERAEMRTIETGERPKTNMPGAADRSDSIVDWNAEDRALVAAAALADLWTEKTIESTILAIDATTVKRDTSVLITLDGHPGEAQLLNHLPDLIAARHPTWQATWRRDRLEIIVGRTDAPTTSNAPLIAPVLTHGRSGKTMRFFPLRSWQHLGIYGGEALGALHALLGSLLYAQSPAALAVAILDRGEITPLYRNVAHLVALPTTPHETIELLAQAIRRGAPRVLRPLLLVVVEPDDDALKQLLSLAASLQARPTTPVHLLITQSRPRSAGHTLYAQLPALIVGGGSGPRTLLPGRGSWPKHGAARLIARGMRIEGRAITLDEAAIVQTLTPLRQRLGDLPPVLWDAPEPMTATLAPTLTSDQLDSARSEQPAAVNQRRIANALTRRRQALMDAEHVDIAVTVVDTPAIRDSATMRDNGTPADLPALVIPDDSTPAPAESVTSCTADRSAQVLLPPMPAIVDTTALVVAVAPTPTVAQSTAVPTLLDDRAPQTEVAPLSQRAELFRSTRANGDASAPPVPTFVPRSRPAATLAASEAVPGPYDPPPMHEPENGWPIGPAPLGRVAMADLMSRVVAAPTIVAGLPSEQGVTKNRLVELFAGIPRAQAKELAEILLVWFDQAGVLVEPTKPGRLRHPRALVTTNLAEIAARLNATPCPHKGTVVAMWAESNEGRN